MAEFEEWPLKDAVLKRVLVDDLATFQLQFTWDFCANDTGEECALGSRRCKPPPKRRNSAKHQANKNPLPRPREDRPLLEINDQKEWEVQDIYWFRVSTTGNSSIRSSGSAGTTTTRSGTTLPGSREALTFSESTIRAIRRCQDLLSGSNSGSEPTRAAQMLLTIPMTTSR
jgi:hypothetical protein